MGAYADGMRTDVLLWKPGSESSFTVRPGRFDEGDDWYRLVRSTTGIAMHLAKLAPSVTGMMNVRKYLYPGVVVF